MSYAFLPSFLQCCWVLLSLSSACLVVLLEGALLVPLFSLKELYLSEDLGLYSLFYPVHIHTALWDSLSGACALWESLSSFPGPEHRKWCGLILQTCMIWANLYNSWLIWLAALNDLEMSQIRKVMSGVHLPSWPHALQYNLRWLCQGGKTTSHDLQLARELHPGLVPLDLLGLQQGGTHSCVTQCQTQSRSPGSGSGQKQRGWKHPLIGGQSFLLWTQGAQEDSNNSRPRDRL